jgi:CRP-like cAMP-binding protein
MLKAGDDKVYADRTMLRGRVFRIIQDNLNPKGYFLYAKQILAEMIGISIRSLNRILKEMENDRLIIVSQGTIQLYID